MLTLEYILLLQYNLCQSGTEAKLLKIILYPKISKVKCNPQLGYSVQICMIMYVWGDEAYIKIMSNNSKLCNFITL